MCTALGGEAGSLVQGKAVVACWVLCFYRGGLGLNQCRNLGVFLVDLLECTRSFNLIIGEQSFTVVRQAVRMQGAWADGVD